MFRSDSLDDVILLPQLRFGRNKLINWFSGCFEEKYKQANKSGNFRRMKEEKARGNVACVHSGIVLLPQDLFMKEKILRRHHWPLAGLAVESWKARQRRRQSFGWADKFVLMNTALSIIYAEITF